MTWLFVIGGIVILFVLIESQTAVGFSIPDTTNTGASGVTLGGNSMAHSALAQAIAKAEGFGQPGAIPTVANNPGDLTAGDFGDTGQYLTSADGSQIIQFPNAEAGWAALEQKLSNIAQGTSSVYSPDMSISDMAKLYAPSGWEDWSANVASSLGVNTDTSLNEVLG